MIHELEIGGKQNIRAVFSPCGRYIGAGQRVYDIQNGFASIELPNLQKTRHEHDVAFQPGGRLFACAVTNEGSKGGVVLYDLQSRSQVRMLPGPPRSQWSVGLAFSPDGRHLAVGYGQWSSGDPTKTAPLVIYEVETGKIVRQIEGFLDGVYSVAWSPDGKWIATGSGVYQHRPMLGEVKVWNAATGELVYDLKGHSDCVWGVSFSPDGRRLASASGTQPGPQGDRGEFIIWDLVSGQQLLKRETPKRAVAWAGFSPDGRWFATAETKRIRIWDLAPPPLEIAPPPRPIATQ